MINKILYAKHLAKKTLCNAYLFIFDDAEIEGYRKRHVERLKELRQLF